MLGQLAYSLTPLSKMPRVLEGRRGVLDLPMGLFMSSEIWSL